MKKNVLFLMALATLFYGCSKSRIYPNADNSSLNIKKLLSTIQSISLSENLQSQNRIKELILRVDSTTAQVGNYYSNQYVSLNLNDLTENIEVKVSNLEMSKKPSKSTAKKIFMSIFCNI